LCAGIVYQGINRLWSEGGEIVAWGGVGAALNADQGNAGDLIGQLTARSPRQRQNKNYGGGGIQSRRVEGMLSDQATFQKVFGANALVRPAAGTEPPAP
jgi:hypothetical protein